MADKAIPGDKATGLNTLKNQDLRKYNVENFHYPENLGQAPDLQHYVVFYINVRGKSQLDKNNTFSESEVPIQNVHYGLTGQGRTEALSTATKESLVLRGAGAGGAVAIAKLFDTLLSGDIRSRNKTSTTNKSGKTSGTSTAQSAISQRARQNGYDAAKAVTTGLIGGALAAGALKAAEEISGPVFKPDKALRLKDIITLHVEERPSVKYGVSYQPTELGSLLGLLTNVGAVSDRLSGTEALQAAGTLAAYNIARIPGILPGSGPKLQDVVGAYAKAKTNPFKEVLFESVDYRKFNFRYRFFPKSAKETLSVYNIVKKFKEHMHPQVAFNGLFYIYPSEFEIKYFYRDKENTWLNKISRCALEDMSVDYGGEQFSTFENGAPTEIGLTLSFKELDLQTRETIVQGY